MSRESRSTTVIQGANLNLGVMNQFGKEFPLARGWRRMLLHFAVNVTIGTGTTPIADGLLNFIKKIYLMTDKNELLCDLGGRPLYFIGQKYARTLPQLAALAAANGTYDVYIPILFVNPHSQRPNDTILDSGRYKSIALQVTPGTIADLFAVPGTATVTCSMDVEIDTTATILPAQAQPLLYRSFFAADSVDASIQQYIDIIRARDLTVEGLMIDTSTGATVGTPFTGVRSNSILSLLNLKNFDINYLQNKVAGILQANNKDEYSLEATSAGIYFIDFVKDHSIMASVYTGNLTQFRLDWTNQAGVAAGNQVSMVVEGMRALKA